MHIDKIPENAVKIPGSIDFADANGNIYGYDNRNNHKHRPYIKEQHTVHGYKYAPITFINEDGSRRIITKRVHRIIAECFIPNPNNYPIVMHIDNDKSNNNVSNLRWGTISENTQQAVNDGLLVNTTGEDDSQSIPCDCYDTCTNKLINTYGSLREAERCTGINLATIRNQMNNTAPIRKRIYFVKHNAGPREHSIIVQYNSVSGDEISRFPNCGIASRETGISESAINRQVLMDNIPQWTKDNSYFKRVLLKCEETIENKQ